MCKDNKIVYITKDTPLEVLRVWLFDLPIKSHQAQQRAVELHTEIKTTERRLEQIKAEEMIKIAEEKDDKGKPKFNNQAVREAELLLRLEKNERYQDYKTKIYEWAMEREKQKIDAEYYDKMFSVVKNLVYDANEKERMELKKQLKEEEAKTILVD